MEFEIYFDNSFFIFYSKLGVHFIHFTIFATRSLMR